MALLWNWESHSLSGWPGEERVVKLSCGCFRPKTLMLMMQMHAAIVMLQASDAVWSVKRDSHLLSLFFNAVTAVSTVIMARVEAKRDLLFNFKLCWCKSRVCGSLVVLFSQHFTFLSLTKSETLVTETNRIFPMHCLSVTPWNRVPPSLSKSAFRIPLLLSSRNHTAKYHLEKIAICDDKLPARGQLK